MTPKVMLRMCNEKDKVVCDGDGDGHGDGSMNDDDIVSFDAFQPFGSLWSKGYHMNITCGRRCRSRIR